MRSDEKFGVCQLSARAYLIFPLCIPCKQPMHPIESRLVTAPGMAPHTFQYQCDACGAILTTNIQYPQPFFEVSNQRVIFKQGSIDKPVIDPGQGVPS